MKKIFTLFAAFAALQAGAQKVDTFDIHQYIGAADSKPACMAVYNDTLFFTAQDRTAGYELRKMGPNMVFPTLVYDMQPGMRSGVLISGNTTYATGGVLYFTAADTNNNYELWSYSGGSIKQIAEITPGLLGSAPYNYISFNEKLYFAAQKSGFGSELWAYDPQSQTTTMMPEVNPGSGHSLYAPLVAYKGSLYFPAMNPTAGAELHRYDPISNTITLVADINTGAGGSQSYHMLEANGKLYFIATTLVPSPSTYNFELWSYDGSSTPVQETDLHSKSSGVSLSSDNQKMLIAWNNSVFFEGYDSTTGFFQLCQFNTNTKAVTFHTVNPTSNANISSFAIYNNKLFFAANDGVHGKELWSFDGTNPPSMAADVASGSVSSNPEYLTVAHDYLYFSAELSTIGRELFRYKDAGVSVENITAGIGGVKLYPNPAEDIVKLQFSLLEQQPVRVSLYDITGRVVYTSAMETYNKGKHEINIPVSDLPSGNYICILKSGSQLLWSGQLKK